MVPALPLVINFDQVFSYWLVQPRQIPGGQPFCPPIGGEYISSRLFRNVAFRGFLGMKHNFPSFCKPAEAAQKLERVKIFGFETRGNAEGREGMPNLGRFSWILLTQANIWKKTQAIKKERLEESMVSHMILSAYFLSYTPVPTPESSPS